jgi:hypothetical protein
MEAYVSGKEGMIPLTLIAGPEETRNGKWITAVMMSPK